MTTLIHQAAISTYHLAGDSAIDNLVPLSAGCPATDIDGDTRPAGSRCDAGADERF